MCKTWSLALSVLCKVKKGGVGCKKRPFEFRNPMGLLDVVLAFYDVDICSRGFNRW